MQMSKFVQPATTHVHGLPGISKKILAEKWFRSQGIANGFLCLIPRFYIDIPVSGSYTKCLAFSVNHLSAPCLLYGNL